MRLVAGVDIGNSTTEVVLLDADHADGGVRGSARAMTRGVKGSPESLIAAARLARRAADECGGEIHLVRVAPWRPVKTSSRTTLLEPPDTSPLSLVARSATTAAGDAVGVGQPVELGSLAPSAHGPVVVLVDARWHYAEAAARLDDAVAAGARVVGVLVERDEAVLVANRLRRALPVIDQVPIAELYGVDRIALEARPAGQPLRHLTDPFWLSTVMDMDPSDQRVETIVRQLQDSSYAVLARNRSDHRPRREARVHDVVRWRTGVDQCLPEAMSQIRHSRVGDVQGLERAGSPMLAVDDLFAVSLEDIAAGAHTRRGTLVTDAVVTATLASLVLGAPDTTSLEATFGVAVQVAVSEAHAGRLGALSTPGAPQDVVVVDLGGGTVDVSHAADRCVAAGAGEMLTQTTASALAVPEGVAEYAKRGPALKVDAPQVVMDENGGRSFLEAAAPSNSIGALCVQGPVGLLPFNRSIGIGEWRAWRRNCKAQIIGRNVARVLGTLGLNDAASVILVGGAAGDDEAVSAVVSSLPPASTIGRGDVGGSLGHRFAVAYGLAQEGVTNG